MRIGRGVLLWVFASILLMTGVWVWRTSDPGPVSSLSENQGASAREGSPAPVPNAMRNAPLIRSSAPGAVARKETEAEHRYALKPEGNLIDFKIVNGQAIAFGDILLGTPEPGFQGDHGTYDAPTPQLWDRAEIPYLINPELPDPKRVERALDYLRQNTPLRFVPYLRQRDAIVFEPGAENCLSGLGRRGGLQPIRLSSGCQSQEILHEILHALGFVHEQSRPDRDRYVEILWNNIDPKYHSQFAIVPDTFLEAYKGSSFDYRSVMIYRPETFAAKPGLFAMRPTGETPISPVPSGLSEGDLRRIRRLYSLYE